MREALQASVKRAGELAEHVLGNEQATKPSLVGPLFTTLGDDLTDPREGIPEYRGDFGPNRSSKLTAVRDNPTRSEPRAGGEAAAGGRIGIAWEELAAHEVIRRLIGPIWPVGFGGAVSPCSMVM